MAAVGCGSASTIPETTAPATTLTAVGATIVDADHEGSGRAVAYVTDVAVEDGRVMASFDFARMLTGLEAEQAARAEGDLADGETLPNDFYIANTDPTTNRLEVTSSAELEIQGCFENGACPTFVPVTLEEWTDLHTGSIPATMAEGFSWYGGGILYGVATEGGRITALVEQYLP